MTVNRRKLLMAYGLAEMASIQEALRALSRRGDAIAGLTAEGMQSWIADNAMEWALQNGMFVGERPERVAESIEDAREYLTKHVKELDELLEEMKGNDRTEQ